MKILSMAVLTLSVFSNLALPVHAQTDYEKCIADATTGAEQTRCALTND